MAQFEQQTLPVPQPHRVRFHASGSEYFRIWIVNLLLTIATLGIYSAWAKVRRTQYMYACTELAGSSFDYHGRPLAILKGRLIALVLFGAYNLAFKVSLTAGGVMLLLLAVVLPWLIWNSLRFKLHNTSYRGLRFGFGGSVAAAYLHYLLLPLLYMFSITLALPFVHQRLKRFQHTQSRYGNQYFSFDATVGSFYKRYALLLLALLAGGIVLGFIGYQLGTLVSGGGGGGGGASAGAGKAVAAGGFIGSTAAVYVWVFVVFPLFLNLIQNLIWNHTSLGPHRFRSEMTWRRLAVLTVTNFLGIIITLGLFTPFAQIRSLRYRLESLVLDADGSLDAFTAGGPDRVGATGVGAADLFDLDLSL